MILLENKFAQFVALLKKRCTPAKGVKLTEPEMHQLVDDIINFADEGRLLAFYPAYKNIAAFSRVVKLVKDTLWRHYDNYSSFKEALDAFIGTDTIPIMTIHKSKGLEYHTVIFVGLEDSAFWTFSDQPDEDKRLFFVALSRAKYRVAFTVSDKRTISGVVRDQSTDTIKVLFDELENSGIVETEDYRMKD